MIPVVDSGSSWLAFKDVPRAFKSIGDVYKINGNFSSKYGKLYAWKNYVNLSQQTSQ